ncbi:MAG: hypothetical protein JXR07_10520 [Reichenbachiella sp.]
MKKGCFLMIAFCCLFLQHINAQVNVREEVYVQLNSTDLIVGESINFSSFTYSQLNGKLSNLSKLLYVELLDQNSKPVFQTKVLQKDGRGFGEIFLPTDLESGNYHFVAYTRWMRNFEDFFHQRVSIINPYKNLDNIPSSDSEIQISFNPEGGTLIYGVENRVIIYAKDELGGGQLIKGKIMSPNGEKIVDVQTDKSGFYEFNLTPTSSKPYQFILENKQEFEFIDLPKAEHTTGIKTTQSADMITIELLSSDENQTSLLKIDSKDRNVYSKELTHNTTHSILKQSLPSGLLEITLDESSLCKRIIWNGELHSKLSEKSVTYKTLEAVKIDIPIPESSNYAVTISKIHQPSIAASIGLAHAIKSNTDFFIPIESYQHISPTRLDHMLICAKSTFKPFTSNHVKFLPELRHGLIQGTIRDSDGNPIQGIEIGMALRGKSDDLNAVVSDSLGHFILRYEPNTEQHLGSIVPINRKNESYSIELESEYYSNYPKFANPRIYMDSTRVAQIIQRSIDNQLENAFQNESISEKNDQKNQSNYNAKIYRLNEYTKFPTMRDTFIEIMGEVIVKKSEKNYDLYLKTPLVLDNQINNDAETMLLLDGVFVSGEDILNLNPNYVEQIDIVQKKYFFGKVMINGIISVHTTTHDGLNVMPKGKSVSLAKTQKSKIRTYQQEVNERMANRNDLLYWNPLKEHLTGDLNLEFRTSQITGAYEIKIDGITSEGEALSRRIYFKVESD